MTLVLIWWWFVVVVVVVVISLENKGKENKRKLSSVVAVVKKIEMRDARCDKGIRMPKEMQARVTWK